MSAAKHTPGPWRMTADDEFWSASHCGIGASEYRVVKAGDAAVALIVSHSPEVFSSPPSTEANARLIAASPRMSELLQRLALLTDDGDDQIKGAAYVDKAGVIRAKGSLLDTLQQVRAVLSDINH